MAVVTVATAELTMATTSPKNIQQSTNKSSSSPMGLVTPDQKTRPDPRRLIIAVVVEWRTPTAAAAGPDFVIGRRRFNRRSGRRRAIPLRPILFSFYTFDRFNVELFTPCPRLPDHLDIYRNLLDLLRQCCR